MLAGDSAGDPTSQTAKKVARHVLESYAGRVTWVLNQVEENVQPIHFDGDTEAAEAFKRVIREARKSVLLWKKKELNDIEEGA